MPRKGQPVGADTRSLGRRQTPRRALADVWVRLKGSIHVATLRTLRPRPIRDRPAPGVRARGGAGPADPDRLARRRARARIRAPGREPRVDRRLRGELRVVARERREPRSGRRPDAPVAGTLRAGPGARARPARVLRRPDHTRRRLACCRRPLDHLRRRPRHHGPGPSPPRVERPRRPLRASGRRRGPPGQGRDALRCPRRRLPGVRARAARRLVPRHRPGLLGSRRAGSDGRVAQPELLGQLRRRGRWRPLAPPRAVSRRPPRDGRPRHLLRGRGARSRPVTARVHRAPAALLDVPRVPPMNLEALDLVVRTVAYPVSAAICLNQVEELFIDASYFARGLHRRDRRRVSAEELRGVEQKRIAILVPAWHEAGVIDQMVERNVASIDYDASRYTFFIGTYPNDPETTGCVEALARRFPNVRPVQVSHEGPTSKADCLNAVHRAICEEERRLGGRYDILVLHDSEDVIHPLALRLYSRLIPRYEFVQTPVFSLELRARNAVGGTYIDEFAEHHLKELRLREAMAGVVPSAGVGTAFERAAFEEVAAASGREPFDPTSLTEDYEIGVKFRLAGRRVHFACATVEREAVTGARREIREDFIATRELFPDRFTASVRQRTRWILGITLQSWARTGWRGPLPVLYSLWRDRKGLGNALLIVAAYALVHYVAARYALTLFAGAPASALCPPGSVLEALFLVNLCGMIWRAAMKGHFVYPLYGATQAFLSFPRAVLGNFISVAATSRAVVTWLGHVMVGPPLRWDKTTP